MGLNRFSRDLFMDTGIVFARQGDTAGNKLAPSPTGFTSVRHSLVDMSVGSRSSVPSVSRSDSGSAFEDREPPFIPWLTLDEDGTIQHITDAARRVLEYPVDERIDPYFFSHVHGRNLRRVMWDVAQMVKQHKKSAQWLLRLRTGNGRWRWYRAEAENHLNQPDGDIRIRLRPLNS